MTARRSPRRRVGKRLRKAPRFAILAAMKPSEYSHVAVLRLAHPDAPSLREVARTVGLSATLLSQFERGIVDVSPAKLALYAKAVDVDPEMVRTRWMQQALSFHQEQVLQLRDAMKRSGRKSAMGRRPQPGKKSLNL